MAILARLSATATSEHQLYQVPASTEALCSVMVCNQNATAVKVRIGVYASGETIGSTPAAFIEYDSSIAANGVLERTGILLSATERIGVRSDTGNVSFVVIGKTDAA